MSNSDGNVKCPHCQHVFPMPPQKNPVAFFAENPPAKVVNCPKCAKPVKVPR